MAGAIIGGIVGALVGVLIGYGGVTGRWVGPGLVEMDGSPGCAGCLIGLVCTALGAGIGYALSS